LTLHFGVAATSPPFRGFVILADVMDKTAIVFAKPNPRRSLADGFVKIRAIRVKFRLLPKKLSPIITNYQLKK
jgi:hypothetical protein